MINRPLIVFVDDRIDVTSAFRLAAPEHWKVRTYNSPIDALKDLDGQTPNALITDVDMPGVHGIDFFTIATKIVRGLPVIVVSAYERAHVEAKFGLLGNMPFFRKPFPDDFWSFVEKVASSSSSSASTGPILPHLDRLHCLVAELELARTKAALRNLTTDPLGWTSLDAEQLRVQEAEIAGVQKYLGLNTDDFSKLLVQLAGNSGDAPAKHAREQLSSLVAGCYPNNVSDGTAVPYSINGTVKLSGRELRLAEVLDEPIPPDSPPKITSLDIDLRDGLNIQGGGRELIRARPLDRHPEDLRYWVAGARLLSAWRRASG